MKRSAAVKSSATVAGVRLVRDTTLPQSAEGRPIENASGVFKIMQGFAELEPAEVFWVLMLDSQHRMMPLTVLDADSGITIVGPLIVSRGILNSTCVHAREVFRAAIVYGAASIILVHNHPSGDPTPSHDDRVITTQLVAAGRLLNIPVNDHVIMGRGRYVSFSEAGLL